MRKQKSRAQTKRKQTLEQKKNGRKNTRKQKKTCRANVTPKQRREQNKKDKHQMRAERNGSTKHKRISQLAADDDDMLPYIDDAVRKAKRGYTGPKIQMIPPNTGAMFALYVIASSWQLNHSD